MQVYLKLRTSPRALPYTKLTRPSCKGNMGRNKRRASGDPPPFALLLVIFYTLPKTSTEDHGDCLLEPDSGMPERISKAFSSSKEAVRWITRLPETAEELLPNRRSSMDDGIRACIPCFRVRPPSVQQRQQVQIAAADRIHFPFSGVGHDGACFHVFLYEGIDKKLCIPAISQALPIFRATAMI